ncbi:MAG: hypothetical protein MI806_01190 [Minwuiales bacterium]|nr:hypothetical protein [Minwuiales bacterium]
MRNSIGVALLATMALAACTPTYNTVCANAGYAPGTPAFEQCLEDKRAEHLRWVDRTAFRGIGGGAL